MSEYTFKNLSEVDSLEAPSEGTTLLGFDGGKAVQIPASAIKGSSVFIIDTTSDEYSETDTAYGNKVKEALLAGNTVYVYTGKYYLSILYFSVEQYTNSIYHLNIAPSIYTGTSTTAGVQFNIDLADIQLQCTLD